MIWERCLPVWRYVAASIRSQMQYRASVFYGDHHAPAAHRNRAQRHRGPLCALWNLARLALFRGALLYGMVNVSFALAEGFGRGFDMSTA